MSGLLQREPTDAHKAAREAVLEAIKPFADEIGGAGILAVLAYTVGQSIAMQDQTAVSPAQAMDLVAANIESGNADAVAAIMQSEGSA